MSKDSYNHRRIFDGGDDLQAAAAVRAVFDVDVEDPFEQPGPTQARRHPARDRMRARLLAPADWGRFHDAALRSARARHGSGLDVSAGGAPLKSLTRVEYADINYKGAGPAAAATSAGGNQLCIIDPGSAIAAMKGGRVRALAITSPQRSKQLPDIPTLAESGVPGYSSVAWIVFLAPSKTSSDLIARINGDVARSFASPELLAKTEALGFEALASSQETAMQELRAYSTKWAQLVKERNIKVE